MSICWLPGSSSTAEARSAELVESAGQRRMPAELSELDDEDRTSLPASSTPCLTRKRLHALASGNTS